MRMRHQMWESQFVNIVATGGLSDRRKAGILATCCLSVLIAGIEITSLNLAIPAIRTDLNATAAHAQWAVAIYSLGVILEEMGKKTEALEEFKKIYEVDSQFRDIAERVEAAYQQTD